MFETLSTASIVADPNATFDERLAVADDLFNDLMIKLDEIDNEEN